MSDVLTNSQTYDFTEFRHEERKDCSAHNNISPGDYKIIQGLAELGGVVGPPTSESSTGSILTRNVSSAGSVPAGSVFARLENVGGSNITVDGQVLPPDRYYVYPTDGSLNPAITYDATGSSVLISATYPPGP